MIEFHELGEIELGLLEHLNLFDENILKWEDLLTLLSDVFVNLVGGEKVLEEIVKGVL